MTREHILAEIRRTTTNNGGIPLGVDRFTAETLIREHDWNRYWARWSDALREAGFSPNEFQQAIPDDVLFEKLAIFARELGRFPVFRDLKVKAHSDPTFPDAKTFQKRGGKAGLAQGLRAFAETRGWSDVAAFCPVNSAVHKQAKDKPLVEIGSVYLAKSGKFYKIGHSNATGRRERELALQLPERLRIIHDIKTDDPAGIERYWHGRFADRRMNGEWFDLTPEQIAAFKRRKTM